MSEPICPNCRSTHCDEIAEGYYECKECLTKYEDSEDA